MKMIVLRKTEYEGHMIYILNFDYVFQYLFADSKGKNIYQHHITLPCSFLNKLKYKLHLIPVPYSKEEIQVGEEIILSGAMTSIDALIKGNKIKVEEMKEVSKVANQHRKNKECMCG